MFNFEVANSFSPNERKLKPKQVFSLRTTPNSITNKRIVFKPYMQSASPNGVVKHEHLAHEDEVNDLKYKMLSLNNTLKEYDNWVNLLLNIVNSKDYPESHFDFGSLIQKRLEKIENLDNDNYELKKRLIKEREKSNNREETIRNLKSQLHIVNLDMEKPKKEILIEERNQLKDSIHCLSEELDDLSEKNKTYDSFIKSDYDLVNLNNLLKELNTLKEENEELKKIQKLKLKNTSLSFIEPQSNNNNPIITKPFSFES